MRADSPVIGVVGCAAGGLEKLRQELVEPLPAKGYRVAVTLAPTAGVWLGESGEADRIASVTGLPARSDPRLPTDASPHPASDIVAVAPATANTVAKLALGVADNQALMAANEAPWREHCRSGRREMNLFVLDTSERGSKYQCGLVCVVGSSSPTPEEKKSCVEVVAQYALDGWAIAADPTLRSGD